jgi:dimethylamine monooxygenase subunit C
VRRCCDRHAGKANNRSEILAAAHVMYCPGPTGTDLSAKLEALGRGAVLPRADHSGAAAAPGAGAVGCAYGDAVLPCGTESLIGQAEREIMATGFPFAAIQKEQRGSTLRRVQCVHCKGITENVATDPFKCSHCGLNLFVRDHYSRRMAAFQGVNIDAEDPGLVPESVVRFK